jgi:osmotically-inducible protein OsmY
MSSDPILSGSDVEVDVDDRDVTLTGTVESHVQHQRVLQLVAQYGRWRKIVDKLKLE